jgi:hypothetical protein
MFYIMMFLMLVAVGCLGVIFAIAVDNQGVGRYDRCDYSALLNIFRRGKEGDGKAEGS